MKIVRNIAVGSASVLVIWLMFLLIGLATARVRHTPTSSLLLLTVYGVVCFGVFLVVCALIFGIGDRLNQFGQGIWDAFHQKPKAKEAK